MSIAAFTKRRIELRMSIRELGTRSQILAGALEEAESRGTIDHFTIAQLRRLSKALNLDLIEMLADGTTDRLQRSSSCAEEQVSDEALAFLLKTFEAEMESGYWYESANVDPPPVEVLELMEAGLMEIVSGHFIVSQRIAGSLGVLRTVAQPAKEITRFSPKLASHVAGLVC